MKEVIVFYIEISLIMLSLWLQLFYPVVTIELILDVDGSDCCDIMNYEVLF